MFVVCRRELHLPEYVCVCVCVCMCVCVCVLDSVHPFSMRVFGIFMRAFRLCACVLTFIYAIFSLCMFFAFSPVRVFVCVSISPPVLSMHVCTLPEGIYVDCLLRLCLDIQLPPVCE